MGKYRDDFDEREFRTRNDRFGRERPWNYANPYSGSRLENEGDRRTFGQGRYGERADYEYNEPRYENESRYAQEDFRRPGYEGRDRTFQDDRATYGRDFGASRYDRTSRSRLRVRDIMTRDLAVATRDTTLREVAIMMKQEDTGVIPVVDYLANGGNGKTTAEEGRLNTGRYNQGKLVGLITDRDIALRAVAEGKDCSATRAEDVMSTDIHSARPHERVVDVIRKMGDKQVRRIPVVGENGNLLGIISMGDVAVETESDSELAHALEEISQESSFWGRLFNY
jgi:CBS domain-containing protein